MTARTPRGFLLLVGILFSPLSLRSADVEAPWRSLFDGKTLQGWTPKFAGSKLGVNYQNTFQVKDGKIIVNYDQCPKFNNEFGHLFFNEKFSHYILRLEYRFLGKQAPQGPAWALRNSGVMLHCQDPKSMAVEQKFPVSIEAQFLGGDGKNKRPTLNLCTPGTHVVYKGKLHTPHCTNSQSKTIHGDEWVQVEIEVHGAGKIIHRVNGEVVMEYEQAQYDPKDADAKKLLKPGQNNLLINEGFLSLQAESHPVEFRNIKIKVLPKPDDKK